MLDLTNVSVLLIYLKQCVQHILPYLLNSRLSTYSVILNILEIIQLIFTALECIDANTLCGSWKKMGYCDATNEYVKQNCRQSCGGCSGKFLKLKIFYV